MKTAIEIIAELKRNKLTRGCKIHYVSNHICIVYQIHKLDIYGAEKIAIKSLFPELPMRVCRDTNNNIGINLCIPDIKLSDLLNNKN